MSCSGTVKNWNDDKGMGFIVPHGGGADVFVLRTGFGGYGRLMPGMAVNFNTRPNDRNPNQLQAMDVSGPGVDVYGGVRAAPIPEGCVPGTVKNWRSDKGFGFIIPQDGGRDVFVLRKDFSATREACLIPGQVVFYRPEPNDRDPSQINARFVTGPGVSRGSALAGGSEQPAAAAAPYNAIQGPPVASRPLAIGGPTAPAPVPPPWQEFHDDSTGNPYWYNAQTGQSVWTRPGGAPAAAPPPYLAAAPAHGQQQQWGPAAHQQQHGKGYGGGW